MPLVPEFPITMLACARLGLPFTVVFSGFSAKALAERIQDCEAKIVVTADGGFRRGKILESKTVVDDAVKESPSVRHVVVFRRTGHVVPMIEGRDYWWDDLMAKAASYIAPVPVESTHLLYILYTSGTTGKPKGVAHSTGGYLVFAYATQEWVFDAKDEDVYWCTADIGWVTGHTYVVFAPLMHGLTSVMYEGALDYPQPDRWWEIVERYGVTILYTAPTAIRSLMRHVDNLPKQHDLDSLRLLGTVGEPINPAAWQWYFDVIGQGHCPIVDTWWQTETGGIMISPSPRLGLVPLKAGSATRAGRSEEHTSELQSPCNLVCRLLLEKKKISLSSFIAVDGVNTTPNSGRIQINLKPRNERNATASDIILRLQTTLAKVERITLYMQPV